MAFCSKCGAEVAGGAAFCATCGQPVNGLAAPAPAAIGVEAGMSENVAGLLCYVLGWITGLIFLLVDKRPFVRFHAAQSLVLFGGLNLLFIVLGAIFGASWMTGGLIFGSWALGALILAVLRTFGFVLWILLMIKAYQGERYRIPVAADIAENIARK